ncbi:MAG: DUF3090 domain-containing protein [Chloroflexi bacterium]|nr:DUF3090 domain-containing protein [Chloroflexota bacterium]
MPQEEFNLKPVDHITTDAIGPVGKRIFYLQAQKGHQTITVLAEKFQVQSLAIGIERFLAEIAQKYPDLPPASSDYREDVMRIHPPVDPLFRIANIGLGFNIDEDLIVMVIHELIVEYEGEEEDFDETEETDEEAQVAPSVARFWCTRSQLLALSRWGLEVVSRGRPFCPQCGEPMDPEGHFCVKKNGGRPRK